MELILAKDTPVQIASIGRTSMSILLPCGKRHRLMKKISRMYPATKAGKVLYGR